MTTKYLAKFQSPRAITRPKIIGPERNIHLICNLWLYTHIHVPHIKSISQSIAKKSGRNCFISELQTWVTLYVPDTPCHKSLTNFITYCWIKYTSSWTEFELATLVVIDTGSYKSNNHTITASMTPVTWSD